MPISKDHYEVIVIGGGPAGSATATFLAQHSHQVLVLEREKFPRYHIGESLMPHTYWQFQRLGVWPKLCQGNFVKKHSVQFIGQSGKESRPFYFSETNPHESAVTWQVDRDKFDQILLENAREHGVEAIEEVRVLDILQQNGKVQGVVAQTSSGEKRQIHAKVVVDATGTSALLAKKLGILQRDPKLNKAAIFTSFKGAHRDPGIDEGATVIVHTKDKNGWFWYIPLANDIVSVGVVADPKYLFATEKDTKKVLAREIANCPAIQKRLNSATQLEQFHACADFSYRATKVAGAGYVLVGDAFGFIDPVYSSGVFLALKSGELAAETIHKAIVNNDFSEKSLSEFGPELCMAMDSLKQLVYTFYNKEFSFAHFLKKHPQYRQNMIDLLTGDVFKEGVNDIFVAMEEYQKQA